MTGESHTDPEREVNFARKLMKRLRLATDTWKEETGIGFGFYGTPAESLCYRFAEIDKKRLVRSRMSRTRDIIQTPIMWMCVREDRCFQQIRI